MERGKEKIKGEIEIREKLREGKKKKTCREGMRIRERGREEVQYGTKEREKERVKKGRKG